MKARNGSEERAKAGYKKSVAIFPKKLWYDNYRDDYARKKGGAELTDEEQLRQVNEAISAVTIGGQSYSIGSRSLTRANLAELRALKADLEARINSANGADTLLGNTSVAFFDGR